MTAPVRSAVLKKNIQPIVCAVSSKASTGVPEKLFASVQQNVMIWIRVLESIPTALRVAKRVRI